VSAEDWLFLGIEVGSFFKLSANATRKAAKISEGEIKKARIIFPFV